MNRIIIKGSWHDVAGKFEKKYAILTDNEIHYEDGRKKKYWENMKGHLVK
jgi:hypothetical protein